MLAAPLTQARPGPEAALGHPVGPGSHAGLTLRLAGAVERFFTIRPLKHGETGGGRALALRASGGGVAHRGGERRRDPVLARSRGGSRIRAAIGASTRRDQCIGGAPAWRCWDRSNQPWPARRSRTCTDRRPDPAGPAPRRAGGRRDRRGRLAAPPARALRPHPSNQPWPARRSRTCTSRIASSVSGRRSSRRTATSSSRIPPCSPPR
jgi:hypothetical protein